jgi:hypothetical protein
MRRQAVLQAASSLWRLWFFINIQKIAISRHCLGFEGITIHEMNIYAVLSAKRRKAPAGEPKHTVCYER